MTLLNDLNVGGQQYGVMGTVPMGTCATPAGTAVKVSAFADDFALTAGNLISVTFTYANTYGDGSTTYPSLTVGSNTYPIKYPNGTYAASGAWGNGQAVTFMFDGTNLILTQPVTGVVASGNNLPVSGDAVAMAVNGTDAFREDLNAAGWYKIAELGQRNRGQSVIIELGSGYYHTENEAHHIVLEYGWVGAEIFECSKASVPLFDKIRLCFNNNDTDKMGIYVHYNGTQQNPIYFSISGMVVGGAQNKPNIDIFNFVTDSKTWATTREYNLGKSGVYYNGGRLAPIKKAIVIYRDILANSWQTGTDGILYKSMGTVSSVIGSGKTVLGGFITYMNGWSEPINLILDASMTDIYLVASTQNAKASRVDVTIIYQD